MKDFLINSQNLNNNANFRMKHTYTTYGASIQYDNKTLIKQANKINEQSKAIDDEGRFSGYASVFNVKDNTNDLVMPGAFRDNLKYPEKIRLLWQHDTLKPIGRVNTLYEDKHGLYVECQILLDLSQGREAYFLIKKGVIKHMSIGYNAEDFFHKGNIRYIRKIKLWEVSLVTFAANKEAKITDIDLKALSENAKKLEQAATKLNWI